MNAIAMDISRLVERAHFSTPTGIDRFELHYARWVNERRKQAAVAQSLPASRSSCFIETGYRGAAAVETGHADLLISELSDRWATTELSPSQAAILERTFAAIDGKIPWQPTENTKRAGGYWRKLRKAARLAAGSIVNRPAMPAGASLMHVSHSRLHRAPAYSWLDGSGLNGVFYVHDLIPLSHPEFVRPGEPERHLRRMETVLRHAALVLCNSQTTARSFSNFAQERGRKIPAVAVLPPGIEEGFLNRDVDLPGPETPYFVSVGTIEPRKNHILLLQLWQHLVERDGDRAPRLVIVGKRGWENSHIVAMLDRCPSLRGIVIEVPGLEDAALAKLLAGATALLSPSFVEGYGMPVTEALAVGTPVIASNIAAHRETGGDDAILLDPLDGLGWRATIDAALSSPRRHKPPVTGIHRWSKHFSDLEALIEGGAATHRAG